MRRYSTKRKSSTKLFIWSTIVIATVFAVSNYFLNKNDDVVVSEVGGVKIFKSEVERKLFDVFEGYDQNVKSPEIASLPKEVIEILSKEIYLEKELDKLAKKAKSAHNKETKEKIKEAKSVILRQAYIDSLLAEEVNEQVIKERYVELTNNIEGKKEYRISHIVVRDKAEAEKMLHELKAKSAKFSELAKRNSIDKESVENGGDLGYVLEDNMLKEIFDGIVNLKVSEVSDPIHTRFGWHLVKIVEIRDARILPFESIKEAIRNQLLQDKISEINTRITKDVEVKILVKTTEAPENKTEAAQVEETKEPAAESVKSESSSADKNSEKSKKAELDEERSQKEQE
jgi:parvulin-like peptidyl-prolyl isomerase